ncbi:MAG: acyl carrier protein [Eubacterium sp.]|nr:acyl carrier protein [Eubacterium sp.]MBQ9322196.1 acyl carrier protein [Eubacterium sp.]
MTFEKVKEIMIDTLNLDEADITLDATLKDLGVDSIDAVELVMALEEAYDVKIADEETAALEKVSDIVEFIDRKVA